MRRRLVWIIGAGILLVAAVALLVVVVILPGGAESAKAAVVERVREQADPRSDKILVVRKWGDGRFVLAAYRAGDETRLALGFALEQRGGWRLTAYTEETTTPDDVRGIGSLFVASSEGGTGQPPWSAAAGRLRDSRVERIEIRWASGEVSTGRRIANSYLILQEGTTTPLEARYLRKDGTEIAKVPIEGAD